VTATLAQYLSADLGAFDQRCAYRGGLGRSPQQYFSELNVLACFTFEFFDGQHRAFADPVLFAASLYNCK